LSDAVAMRLPVIVERNVWTLAHERYNTDWVLEQRFGMVVSSFSRIVPAVAQMLDAETYRAVRERTAADRNRAIFEIPDPLAKILAQNTPGGLVTAASCGQFACAAPASA
jgi:1,2-diacylglycerol 3-beta-galactosyltransferase